MSDLDSPVVVTATIRVKPESADAVELALTNTVKRVQREPGNLRYDVHRMTGKLGVFVIIETWSNAQSLKSHGEGDVLRELLEQISNDMISPLEILQMSPVG